MERDSFHRGNTAPAFPDSPDEVLLAAFVRTHDERIFRAIVKRHERMVLSVCRRVLHHWQDAENAVQRTWLVLLRKAASIRKGVSLRSWLHGVADRAARNLRQSMRRRRKRVKLCGDPAQPAQPAQPEKPVDELAFQEEQSLIVVEVQLLPEELRDCFT